MEGTIAPHALHISNMSLQASQQNECIQQTTLTLLDSVCNEVAALFELDGGRVVVKQQNMDSSIRALCELMAHRNDTGFHIALKNYLHAKEPLLIQLAQHIMSEAESFQPHVVLSAKRLCWHVQHAKYNYTEPQFPIEHRCQNSLSINAQNFFQLGMLPTSDAEKCQLAWEVCKVCQSTSDHKDHITDYLTFILNQVRHLDLTLDIANGELFCTEGELKVLATMCEFATSHFAEKSISIKNLYRLYLNEIEKQTLSAVSLMLASNPNLTSIGFENVYAFSYMHDSTEILEAIKSNDSITALSFKECRLVDKDANALAKKSSLKIVNFDNEFICVEGTLTLINHSTINSLSNNAKSIIFEIRSEELLAALKRNLFLTSFTIEWVTAEQEAKCNQYLARNQNTMHLFLASEYADCLPAELIQLIFAHYVEVIKCDFQGA